MVDGGTGSQGGRNEGCEDLSRDWALAGAPRMEFEGTSRPALGGIPLLRRLGTGAMGVVYFGVHPRLGTDVAVKILPRALLEQQSALAERFLREARLAARLRSQHLVSVLDVDRDEASGVNYIVMEFVRGVSAEQWLDGILAQGQPGAQEALALDVVIGATRGLVAAHLEGVIHRDVKPGNILIPAAADGSLDLARAKLSDLGLARSEVSGESLTNKDVAVGTPGYFSPEQARDAKQAKKPADVFGMGATLYALLAGSAPFRGASPVESILRTLRGSFRPVRRVRPDVSAPTAALIERCLSVEPAGRFPDASALLDALETCRAALGQVGDAERDAIAKVARFAEQAERGKKALSDPELSRPPPGSPDPVVIAAAPAAVGARASRREAAPARRTPWLSWAIALVVVGAGAFLWIPRDPHAPQAATGELRVETDPPGATVRVAGLVRGTTPLRLPLDAGTYDVRVESKGFEPVDLKAVEVPRGGRLDLRPSLVVEAVESGLVITSEPPGAVAFIDERQRGFTPISERDLSDGRHTVRVMMKNFVRFASDDVVTERGKKTVVHATLVRATVSARITGPPGARVRLTREGLPAKSYELDLDSAGALARDVEAGTYDVEATAARFEPFHGRLVADADESASPLLAIRVRERTARLTVTSRPVGADVVLDDRRIGTAPIERVEIAPGEHRVTVRAPTHEEKSVSFRARGDESVDLGEVVLPPWPLVDLKSLDDDVVARIGERRLTPMAAIPPGPQDIVLERPEYAPQTVHVEGSTGQVLVVEPRPWPAFQARIDWSEPMAKIPKLQVTVDGTPAAARRTGAGFARAGPVWIRLDGNSGFFPLRLVAHAKLGETVVLRERELKWVKAEAALDLSDFDRRITFEWKGKPVAHGDKLPPGPISLVARFEKQRLTVPFQVPVFPVASPPFGSTRPISVTLALQWLARHQSADGSWSANGFADGCHQCSGPGKVGNDAGVTGLAVLAFLTAGETHREGEHKESVRRGLEWLRANQDAEGCVGPRSHPKFIYSHGCGALALCEALRLTGDEGLVQAAQRASDFVAVARNPYFAWRYGVKPGENDTSVTGWMHQVLRSALWDGLLVDSEAFDGIQQWVKKMTDDEFGNVGYMHRGEGSAREPELVDKFPNDRTEAMTAVALLDRILARQDLASNDVQKGIARLVARLPSWNENSGEIDMYYWYYGTSALVRAGGEAWEKWRPAMLRALSTGQVANAASHEYGSWPPLDPWASEGGRVYSTAICAIVLNRCLAVDRMFPKK